jgi:hypothetical protein
MAIQLSEKVKEAAMAQLSGEPSYEHVMIDIETMSLHKHNALILSVGMIEFDPTHVEELYIGARQLLLPSISHQLALGREVSIGTQKFWKDQKPEAREHWVGVPRMDLSKMCWHIRNFCQNKTRVWANGKQFDLANLEELNNQIGEGKTELWHYQAPRDMRSFCRETPATRLPPGDLDIVGVPHEPVYDCIVQAWHVWEHWSL